VEQVKTEKWRFQHTGTKRKSMSVEAHGRNHLKRFRRGEKS
jgi:hypothetical protein